MITLTVLAIFMCLMLFGYKKMVKAEMAKEMNLQINELVSKYFEMEK